MAITKTLIANGSKGYHKFTLNVTEARTSGNSSFNDYSFILSPIQTGWDWYDHGGGISYEVKIGDKTFTGTIPAYNGSSTIVLASGSDIEIVHDVDGTKTIEISFKVTDITGADYTCGNASASGSMILSALHTPPEITNVSISETNTTLTNLGVTNDTIVQYLSKKKFTITATTYDDAKISSYSIYHNNVLIGTSTTNEVIIDFSNVSELMTSGTNYVGLTIAVIDDKDGYKTRIFNFPVIKYTRPTIESTSTTIKRKTSGGTVLTDNKALLNFIGTCYKGNDVIGNANKPTVQYKIWNTTEPSYTTVTSTNTANVTVKDFEISNIAYTSVYNYKIKIYDVFTNSSANPIEKTSIVPTGVSVWDEYKDRVNFLRATIGNKDIVESGETATTKYIKYYDGTMICTGKATTDILTWEQDASIWHSRNHTLPDFPQEFIEPPIVVKSIESMNISARSIWISGNSVPTTKNPGTYNLATYWGASDTTCTISYIAVGKWK